ncbi:hypothetical protein VIGAN_06178300 [Vigna angularis var. angularis]|uniref:Uncharacterized protein n=1 Tax=Vigna angularis var. angularis TaxID=157739 RepID=A0A0S3SCI1_PHAAN|nr:hypothetical protein VIGAN_06178300 [Vigna angularis var. angularis]
MRLERSSFVSMDQRLCPNWLERVKATLGKHLKKLKRMPPPSYLLMRLILLHPSERKHMVKLKGGLFLNF